MTTTLPRGNQATATTPSLGLRQRLREHCVFLLATAAVILHIADDNFFQPAAGVGPGDHLVSGLVPIGLLAAGAAAYPSVRAGARGALAIAVGLMGSWSGWSRRATTRSRSARRATTTPDSWPAPPGWPCSRCRRSRSGAPAGLVAAGLDATFAGSCRNPRHRVPHRGLPPVRYQPLGDPFLHGGGAGGRSRGSA